MPRDLHGLDAAGAGNLGTVSVGESLGLCPSCGFRTPVVAAAP